MIDLVPPPATSGKSLMECVEDALLPLINLVFLLLMFFIVAGQIADAPLPELPAAAAVGQEQQPYADLVILANGDLQIAGETVSPDRLNASLPKPGGRKPLKVAAAEAITMADLEALFRVLERAGHTDILLLTEPGV